MESVECGVVSVPSLLFPALSHSPSSLPSSWQWQRAPQMAQSLCWGCHHLLACFVLLSPFKPRTTLQSYFGIFKVPSNPSCSMSCLFAFHQLGSADFSAEFSAEFAFWVLGGEGGCREQLLRAVNMSGTSEMHLEKSMKAVWCSCTGSSVLSMVVVWWCRS